MTLFFPVLVSAMLLVTTSVASENFNSIGIGLLVYPYSDNLFSITFK